MSKVNFFKASIWVPPTLRPSLGPILPLLLYTVFSRGNLDVLLRQFTFSVQSLRCYVFLFVYMHKLFFDILHIQEIFIYIYTRWLTFPRVHAHAVHAGLTAWGRRCDVQAKSTVCYYAVVCYYAINCEYYALWILMNTYDTYDQYRWSTTPRHCSNSRTTSHWFAFSCQWALYNPLNFTPHCLHLFVGVEFENASAVQSWCVAVCSEKFHNFNICNILRNMITIILLA